MTRKMLSVKNRSGTVVDVWRQKVRNGSMPAAEMRTMMITTIYRQIRFRMLPGTASVYRWPDGILKERADCCRRAGKGLTYQNQCKTPTECRNDPDLPWMRKGSSRIRRGMLKCLNGAYSPIE